MTKPSIPRICRQCQTPFLAYACNVKVGFSNFCGRRCFFDSQRRPLHECFWEKVEKIPFHTCWEWTGARMPTGYGQLRREGRALLAHRISWELHRGAVPKGLGYHGTCVLHRCDNPSCVNPDHLFLGTQTDNNADKVRKGRQGAAKGEEAGPAKLTEALVREIRASSVSAYAWAKRLGLGYSTIQQARNRTTWRHVL